MSDHKHIYFEVQNYNCPPPTKVKYSKINYEKLYKTYEETTCTTNNGKYEALEGNLKSCLAKSKITSSKLLYKPKDNWINKEIILGLNKRNELWKKIKINKANKENEQLYIDAKTNMRNIIRETKVNYYKKCFQETSRKPKKMWSLIADLTHNNNKNQSLPERLAVDLRTITDTKEICESFNNYFSSIGIKLANDIPSKYHNHEAVLRSPTVTSQLNVISHTTADEINKIIDSLDPNCSCGIDGITTKVVKCLKSLIKNDLAYSINECFKHGTFPENLKIAKVSPIYKSGSKLDPNNYRPISVLPVLSKILKKLYTNV